MIYGLYTSAGGALQEIHRVNAVSNNLANANTVGFRRDVLSFRERAPESIEDRVSAKHFQPLLDRLGGGPRVHRSAWEKVSGPIHQTFRPLDLAIDGEGFFAVRRGGETFYTRAGNFQRLPDGRVVTADGRFEVMSVGENEPLVIPAEIAEADIHVRENGVVTDPAGDELGTVQVVQFDDLRGMEKFGDTVFRATPAAGGRPADPAALHVRQGAVEQSTANAVEEMVEMIDAMRAYEANMQMIRFQDSTLDRAVNDIGRVAR